MALLFLARLALACWEKAMAAVQNHSFMNEAVAAFRTLRQNQSDEGRTFLRTIGSLWPKANAHIA